MEKFNFVCFITVLMTDDVELVFNPPSKRISEIKQVTAAKKIKSFATKLSQIDSWFDEYKVDSIELWIEGGVKEGEVTKLFVSFEGKGGCKVTLKPKKS